MVENYDGEPSDVELVEACRTSSDRDNRAFEAIVRRYEPIVFRVCLRILGREADANDVIQEVFLRVYRHLANFEGRASFKTWILKIARNECFSFVAKNRDARLLVVDDLETLEPMEAISFDPVERQLIAEDLITKTLNLLTIPDREILVLRFVAEQSLDEISSTLSLSLSATKMRLYRAVERFTLISNKQSQ